MTREEIISELKKDKNLLQQEADKDFFALQLQIDPLPIIDFRNIISHEYEVLDYQIIYKICTADNPLLKQKIKTFFIKQQ